MVWRQACQRNPEAARVLGPFQPFLRDMHQEWESALRDFAASMGCEGGDVIRVAERKTGRWLSCKEEWPGRTVLGLAGPGGVGKGTLADRLGYPKVVNTTTRPRRANEVDGVHYHFLTEEEFARREGLNPSPFISVTDRPGRGRYGVQRESLDTIFSNGSPRVIVEENPLTLQGIMAGVRGSYGQDVRTAILYVLPPYPIVGHLATRVAGRCKDSGEEITEQMLESTLGRRQVAEFRSAVDILQERSTPVLFVINDDLNRAAKLVAASIS